MPSRSFYCNSASTPTTRSPLSSSSSLSFFNGYNGISLKTPPWSTSSTTYAKFEKFQGEDPLEDSSFQTQPQTIQQQEQEQEQEEEEDDSCLPSDLEGAVRQSSEASSLFVSSGGMRAIVELLIPQLQFLDDEGAQSELWELSRTFLDTLIEETGCQKVKAIFPDAGAAALLKYRWKDAAFGFSSLSDRKPVENEDEIVVMVVPDYQMLQYVEKIASNLSDDPPKPLIMWNPRLISEDVGVGINVRNLRRYFLSTFTTVYSMRPLPTGAVFRCYPGLWKVFYDDKDRPNRYLLAKEFISRPNAEDLEILFGDVEANSEDGPSLFSQAASIFSSLNRFMKAISK
ncbi:uncharacterized protein LOC116128601 isoform X1 [Pistacia vera]|uniref:uncharacterized protein LOC116128601 isoform X1 n=2 Tax=Pistacia vera TaxID=55513 RepID=UPI001263A148|nr:uncharacterized protein LOC116128601 isoform X1 [Pistacia vera]